MNLIYPDDIVKLRKIIQQAVDENSFDKYHDEITPSVILSLIDELQKFHNFFMAAQEQKLIMQGKIALISQIVGIK